MEIKFRIQQERILPEVVNSNLYSTAAITARATEVAIDVPASKFQEAINIIMAIQEKGLPID